MERPEIYHSYDPSIPWKKIVCPRCLEHGKARFRWCCQHHVDGKKNSDRSAWVCSNGNPDGIVYPDACHQWIHANPKLAEAEGYHNPLKSGYNKKSRDPRKWVIKKRHSGPEKWQLKK